MKIVLFMSDVQNYIPIKLCKTSGSLHLFKNKRHVKARRYKAEQQLFMGHIRDKSEWN